MGTCLNCRTQSPLISDKLGLCADCIREDFPGSWPRINQVHQESRKRFDLPLQAPKTSEGTSCGLCIHDCRMGEGEAGYCGLRQVQNGRITGGRPHEGNLRFMLDPLPTNCVADFICPGGTGSGYPEFAHKSGAERGYKNLAVFYQACGFNCLFCQNYHFKLYTRRATEHTPAKVLAASADRRTSCICYFGGDPTPHLLHAIKTSRLARKHSGNGIMRICWESNGSMNPAFLRPMYELSLVSGGCIKFDLKAWSEPLHYALCGVSNRRTLENFRTLAKRFPERLDPPLLTASTLLVPGYVDEPEVRELARFLASLDIRIPYSLLAFYPVFELNDLPVTNRDQAERCRKAALEAGLKHVHLGNEHLLR